MSETVKIPLVGETKKSTAVVAGLAVAGVFLVLWSRQRKAAAAGTDTGNIDPATGYPSGSPADQQALADQQAAQDTSGGLAGLGPGGFTAAPFYGTGGSPGAVAPGPGGFVDNAEWAQYAQQYLTQNTGASPAAVGQALGAYIQGQPLTPEEIQVVEEAIAFAGKPPVAGAHGDPPGFRTAHKPPPRQGDHDRKVRVPDVKGKRYEEAARILRAHHLRARRGEPDVGTVGSQRPDAGDQAARNSAVILYPAAHHRGGK